VQLTGARQTSLIPSERQRSAGNERGARLQSAVATVQIRFVFEANLFTLHIRVSRFSGGLGGRYRALAALWRRCPGLGEAIWRDFGGYRVAEIHSDFCIVGDPASGSSLFSFEQTTVYFPGMVCSDEGGGYEK